MSSNATVQLPPTEVDIRRQAGDTYYIYSSNLSLTQADIPYALPQAGQKYSLAKYKVHIQADTVTLNGTLVNRGKDFSLVARRIIVASPTIIDVSGPDPTGKDFAPGDSPQQLDTSAGATGTKGADADNGLDAGNIFVFAESVETSVASASSDTPLQFHAIGGRGGRGQDGHQGMQGLVGDVGPKWQDHHSDDDAPCFNVPSVGVTVDKDWMAAHIFNNSAYNSCRGGTGKTGGTGGLGGHGGTGGSGGKINCATVYSDHAAEGNRPVTLKMLYDGSQSVDGGARGDSQGGSGGPGGPGGLGGEVVAWVTPPGAAFECDDSKFGNASAGDTGHTGSPGQGQPGQPGKNGLVSVDPNNQWTYAQLAPSIDCELLLLTQRVAKLAYLNAPAINDYSTPLTLFQWLSNVTAATGSLGFPVEVLDVWQAVNSASNLELTRFSQGLDYYGHTASWAPTLTLNFLTGNLDTVLPLAAEIEADFDKFSDETADAATRQKAYAGARDNVNNVITKLTDMQNNLDDAIDSTFNALDQQNDLLGLQKERITQAKEVFDQAWSDYVADQTKCTLSDVLDVLKAIVSMGSAAYEGVGAITGAFGAVEELGSDLSKFKDVVEKVQKVAGDIDSIRTGWNTVSSAITPDNPDGGKLVMEQKDFDNAIKPYMDKIPAEAEALKEAVDHYVDLVKGRNKLVTNYNSLFIKKADLGTQIAQRQAELNNVDVQYKVDTSGTVLLPIYLSFMQQAYDAVREYVVWLLYEENRAYQYWSLTDNPFVVSDLRISFLAQTHVDIKQKIVTAMGDTERLNTSFRDVRVMLDLTNNASAFAQLASQKKLTVQLDIDDPAFQDFCNVRAESLTVALPDFTPDTGTLTLSLTHNGDSPFYTYDAGTATLKLMEFTHQPLTAGFQQNYAQKEVTGICEIADESQGYANLSPFTLWTINFDQGGNEWLDLTQVQRIELSFNGTWQIIKELAAQAQQA